MNDEAADQLVTGPDARGTNDAPDGGLVPSTVTGVDADLAALRRHINTDNWPWLDRVEAELSRRREQRDRMKAAAKLRGQYRDEWRERAEAAEARCARLQQELRLVLNGIPDPMHPSMPPQWVDRIVAAQIVALEALGENDGCDVDRARATLAGPDTPAIPPRPPIQPPGHQREMADTPADSPVARTEHKQKGLLTPAQRDELERFVDGQPHQLTGSAASGPARNLVRRNLLTRAPIMAGFYRITEYGRALLGEDTPADSQEDKT
jgi:hypothetical protein